MRLCPVCSAETGKIIMSLPVTCCAKVSLPAYDMAHCVACDTIYVASDVTKADLEAQYDNEIQFSGSVYRDTEKIEIILQVYTSILSKLFGMMGKSNDKIKILEVGAGLSWVNRCAKAMNSKIVTVAQDLSDECIAECTWVDNYIIGQIGNPEIAQLGPYDIVSMTHVIEHIFDPVAALRIIKLLLNPTSLLYVTAPHRPENWCIGGDREIWRKWSYNHVPDHLQYFSRRSFMKASIASGLFVHSFNFLENRQAFEAILVPVYT